MSHKPLDPEVRMLICRSLGEYKRPIEIQKELAQRGVPVQLTSIHYYDQKAEWKSVVDKFRREYLTSVMKIPIAQKVHRLHKLDDLIYGLENNDGRYKFNSDEAKYDRLLRTLDQARMEMEPSKHDTYNVSISQYNNLTDEEIKSRKTQLMEKILKVQKQIEEAKDATDSKGGENPPLDVEAVRVKEGEASILREPKQGNDNGDTQEVKPHAEV